MSLRAQTMVLAGLLLIVQPGNACSWTIGHFHQVTRLRGSVVGVKSGDLRHPFRVLRQHVVVGRAKLTLYAFPFAYMLPGRSDAKEHIVKQVDSDEEGNFDFGALPDGHYTLLIASPWGEDRFDVQVMQLHTPTTSVMIDVSPNYPDCTGGHEFISVSE